MILSNNAIEELRQLVRYEYGPDVEMILDDEDINNLGNLLLFVLEKSLEKK